MNEQREWSFQFGLFAKKEGESVSEEQAAAVMESIIDFCEEHGLCIGGGFVLSKVNVVRSSENNKTFGETASLTSQGCRGASRRDAKAAVVLHS